MNDDRMQSEVPPPEAYSRVTNPERFALLHSVALQLLGRLQMEFDVERLEGHGLDSELEEIFTRSRETFATVLNLNRPSVALMPRDVTAAPMVVSFSAFPGLRVRFGRWHIEDFPRCGCDACNETAESEAERLTVLIGDLTAGRFREGIRIHENGNAWKEHWFEASSGTSQLDPVRARELIAGSERSTYEWAPWPGR